jgi:hypothetical protein
MPTASQHIDGASPRFPFRTLSNINLQTFAPEGSNGPRELQMVFGNSNAFLTLEKEAQ